MKKILKIMFLIMLIISLFQINSVYALYKNELIGTYKYSVGKWNISVNETQIQNEVVTNLDIDPLSEYFVFEENENCDENIIAPGTIGYMYYNIDAGNTDVSIIYSFKIKLSSMEKYINNVISNATMVTDSNYINAANLQIIEIENYYKKDEETIKNTEVSTSNLQISNTEISHTGVFKLDKILDGYINVVKVKVKWIDYDDVDTAIGSKENIKYTIPIEATFKQYVGEEI